MKIKAKAEIILQAGFKNSNKTPEEIMLAVENQLNERFGRMGIIDTPCSVSIFGFRIHIKTAKEIKGRKL